MGKFVEFENVIPRETFKTLIPRGAIHPLTRFVMNYINFLFDYTYSSYTLDYIRKKEAIPRQISDEFTKFP